MVLLRLHLRGRKDVRIHHCPHPGHEQALGRQPRGDHDRLQVERVHRRPERLVVVERVPIADELLEQRHHVGILRLFEVQHQPARRKYAEPLADDPRQGGAGQLVQVHRRLHPVEMPVGIAAHVLGIHLHEAEVRRPERLRAGMTVAQRRRGGVDGDDFGLRKGQRQRHDIVADGATQIEDAPRCPIRPFAFDPVN